MKKVAVLLAVILLIVTFSWLNRNANDKKGPKGEADRLGGWANINQTLVRSEDWQQIVRNSAFQLGKRTEIRLDTMSEDMQDLLYDEAQFWHYNYGDDYSWQGDPFYSVAYGTYPCLDGSTVAVPLLVEFARQHLGFSDDIANRLGAVSTTHDAYLNLIQKLPNTYFSGYIGKTDFIDTQQPVDLIIATAASADELALAAQEGVTLIQKPICYDAFVFITNVDNPVNSLTIEQIKGIYSGSITNWKEVGGKDQEIIPYQREANSGSQTAMIELVMKDTPMLPAPMARVVVGMGHLVEAVAEYQNDTMSIGYTYKYYVDMLYKNPHIKTLKIDGISADDGNIRLGLYPLTTNYYGVIRSTDKKAVGGRFLDWILSQEGQLCVRQAGYITMTEQ